MKTSPQPQTRFHNLDSIAVSEWTTGHADETYQISRWGEGYFSVNDKGDLCINPTRTENGPVINMMEILEEMKNKNIPFPTVIRFHDILRSQVAVLNKTFRALIEEAKFTGSYYGVYPIKVNQMREVVEEIVDAGAPFNYGLEAGSKPELLAALAMNSNQNSLTVVNGYKDLDLLRLALLGNQLGRKVIVVIEKYTELLDLMKLSAEVGVEPMIGLRAKISTKSSGKWASSGGDYAKFGLSITEILQAVKYMKSINKTHCLKLLHFHIGSQIPDIKTIKDYISEGARIYAKLYKEGAKLEFFDVGGGVGVNYDGTRSNSPSSINYTTRDYVADVVYILKQVCDLEDVPHPNIVSESGRAITAHHSCVITNVFGALEIGAANNFNTDKAINENILVTNIRDLWTELTEKNYQEIYNDATKLKEESISAFKFGILTLDERAKLETLFWNICRKIVVYASQDEYAQDEIMQLKSQMASQYMCNLSIFQSAPDTWAIGQILPVLPIHKLNEKPTELCTLVDITCDSDGKLDTFLSADGPTNTVPLHKLKEGEDYYIGLFMTGAYQDIMGDNHNCFGRLNEVHIFCDDDDPTDFYIEEVIYGNQASQVLSTLQYNPETMAQTVKALVDTQVKRGKIRPREGVDLTDFYESCLKSYTYLKK
ncbi:MAG TPA: biosynthetic arginine decarboxylase [Bacteriovoracaceae bacterium]|nr:biosynthetic arginine decarboxylase [Bacteriovoracaceae bacterium]